MFKNNKFLFVGILAIPFFLLGTIFASALFASSSSTVLPAVGALEYNSHVCADVVRADGTVESAGCSSNFFTPDGRNLVMDYLGGTTGLALVKQIAIGNISNGATATYSFYIDSGLTNATGTFLKVSNPGNWSISNTFTSTADNKAVNGTALLNGSTTGAVFFANNTFTAVTLNTNDAITIRWNVSIS